MNDSIRWEILEDGTISITTDGISKTNHVSADELLTSLAEMIGGTVEIEKRRGHVHRPQAAKQVHHH